MVSSALDRRYAPLGSTFLCIPSCALTSRKRSKSFGYAKIDMEKPISAADLKESHVLSTTVKSACIDVSDQGSIQDQAHAIVDDADSGICVEESSKSVSNSLHVETIEKNMLQNWACDLTDIEDSSDMPEEMKAVETSSPTLPRLLGAIRAEESNACISIGNVQSGGNNVGIDKQSDLACAQSARDAFLARQRRVANRKIFMEKESIAYDSGMVEEHAETCSPKLQAKPSDSTPPFPRLLGSVRMQMPNSHITSDVCDTSFDREPIANHGDADASDVARACAQSALEAFRSRQHRVTKRNSLVVALP